ncbi:disulfide bond formation protein B [Litorimonas sp. RW-G-Af-16]|uniref:disulfide bond formation protein B n=1 Tax=Litorimonas sp. RW-G-Af-16 TaxID=3241168 RepID=UPI00390C44AF
MKAITHHPASAALFALLLSSGLLVGAWIFQYGFGYAPCTMCYWQRHAHKAVIVLAALALGIGLMSPKTRTPLLALTVLALLVSGGLGAYHTGVEFGFWDGPKECSAGGVGDFAFDPADPLAALDKPIKPPSCSEAVWHFLGLSMAAWNAILSFGGAAITVVLAKIGGRHGA